MSDEIPRDAGEYMPGAQIAGYRLEEEIGRGGMAVVYRAHDIRLDRSVALKILSPELARDQAFRQRFVRESRAAAAVDHPNIIPIFEAGEASGVLFIAMRYVQGRDLRSLLDRAGQLPAAYVANVIAQMASALDAAHARGLVHRDVKPANMLLDAAAGSDQRAHVYLSDFGLSKQSLAAADLTSAGQFLGTLDYVAPEQIEGRPVDGRADLYALACAAFEMLSGTPPFERDQRLAVLWAQLSEPPPAVTERRPDLPPAVNQVMARALAKSPGDRYASCLDFAAALRAACGIGSGEAADSDVRPPAAPGAGARGTTPPRPATELAGPAGAAAGRGGAPGGPGGSRRDPAAHPGTEVAAAGTTDAPGRPGTEVAAAGTSGTTAPGDDSPAPPRTGAPPAAGATRDAGAHPGTEVAAAGTSGTTPPGDDSPAPPRTGAAGAEPHRPDAGPHGEPHRPDSGHYGGGAPAAGSPPRQQQAWEWPPLDQSPPTGRSPQVGPPQASFPAAQVEPPDGRRPWMRSRAALVVACAAVVGLAGAAFAIHVAGNGGTQQTALTVPACTKATATARPLTKVHRATVSLPGVPFAVAVTHDGQWSFVTTGRSVAVLRNGDSLAPSFVRTIPVPSAAGESFTHDGRYLLVTSLTGAAVINVSSAEQGSPDAVIGRLASTAGGSGADQVAISPDDRFAFITIENSGYLAVFNLHDALANGFGPANFVGSLRLGERPVGMQISSDGRWLYVVTERRSKSTNEGTLTVLNLRQAETKPAASVAATVNAGCSPVRVINSADGSVVWVTARLSNALLGFSAAKLRSDPQHALIARVLVGEAPIGLTFINHEKRIVVADSNVFAVKGARTSLSVVNTSAALAGQPAMLGLVHAGRVPRQFTVAPNGKTLLVTNSGSGQLEAVNIGDLP